MLLYVPLLDWRGPSQLIDKHGCSAHNISEPSNDLRERALANNNQGSIENGDALSGCLEGLGLVGDRLDTVGDLLRSGNSHGRGGHGDSSEDLGEEHFDCGRWYETVRVDVKNEES